VSGQLHTSVALPPEERAPSAHWRGGWVGPSVSQLPGRGLTEFENHWPGGYREEKILDPTETVWWVFAVILEEQFSAF
jgi:hypothetical protein